MSKTRKVKPKPQPTGMFRPGAYILRVEHDDWCDKLKDLRLECTCRPNHRIVPVGDTWRLN